MCMQRCILSRASSSFLFCFVLILGSAEALRTEQKSDITAELFFSLGSERQKDYRKKYSTKRRRGGRREGDGRE